ncbi:MAG: hypothetical protein ABIN91_01055 [Mucilaginibacter sp.]|uniref:hypothetical protein n=1 Tax=Mucilaginibacter sp. TaxID=1882438 RepID=UPI003262EEEB
MTTEELANEAITYHLSTLYNINSLPDKYNKTVLTLIGEIATYATNDPLWSGDDDEFCHEETKTKLALKYPFLTEASKIKMADAAAYFWK